MTKLLKLKKWLSLYDAASEIRRVVEEAADAGTVLRLALDGHLNLSVHLVNGGYGRLCVPVDLTQIEWDEVPSLDGGSILRIPQGGRVWEYGGISYQVRKTVTELNDGIWRLPLIGGERIDVEAKYQQLNLAPEPTAVSLDGVFVQTLKGEIYEVQARFAKGTVSASKLSGDERYYPAGSLPEDIEFVVLPEDLEAFLVRFREGAAVTAKPLGNRERDSLLAIIAVLCKEAKLDYTRHAKTAGLIQSTAAGMGIAIGESTIEGHLKKIPDALATRIK